ncbi:dihydrofolate reductase family protein [Sulfuriferula nivalis]|uniref:Riboflavin biosynthesis protein RibD n=1 Tax=Sulfuriferula nivalis TaxID=2675298 RepID=A0A809RK15_9PROT|nr:dihydrofolate reductase family protein [Sulfuriferula nivalis]BBP02289.1 riboflavin biosynthesis protein RibD [Sulfuriferula nivalis]
MRKIVSFAHVSLDGFVASTTEGMHSLGWITMSEELFSYAEQRILQTDTALYGRVTYQMMESYWPTAAEQPNASPHDHVHSRWYKTAHKIVLSKTLLEKDHPNTKIISSNLSDEICKLKHGAGSEILVFGSPCATHALMAENLIDEYWLFINPILLWQGIPLFKNINDKTALTLVKSKIFASGVVCLHYEVQRNQS